LISNSKMSSSVSDEEMNAIVSILAVLRVEPCRLAMDDILLQGKFYFPVDLAYSILIHTGWPKKTGPLCYIASNFRNTA